jgi:serine/threonine protein kinase
LPRIEGFSIVGLIGEGGFSRVYEARQSTVERSVALKVFRTTGRVGKRHRERFEREASIVGQLSTADGLVTVFLGDFTQSGAPYLAMELCEGGSLADRIREFGPLPLDEAMDVAERIGRALAFVHSKGVSHRDVKPSNILMAADGSARLTDFGLSVVGEMNDALGDESRMAMTEVYAPPERLNPDDTGVTGLDALGDQYSFALTIYSMLLGGSPFTGQTTTARALKALGGHLEPLGRVDVPFEVVEVLLRGMERDPADRWESIHAMLVALSEVRSAGGPSVARPSTSGFPGVIDSQGLPGAARNPLAGDPDAPTGWSNPRTHESQEWAAPAPPKFADSTEPAATPHPSRPAQGGARIDPSIEAESTQYGGHDPGIEFLEPAQPHAQAARPRRSVMIAGGVALAVALVVAVVFGVVRSRQGDGPTSTTTSTIDSTTSAHSASLPELDPIRLTDSGLAFSWTGDVPAAGAAVLYQVQVDDSRTALAQPVDTDSSGAPVQEQFVTGLEFEDGTEQAIDADAHRYCVVVLFVPMEGDTIQSEPECVGS